MATGAVFSISGSGEVIRMRPGAPELETDIQELIARFPDLIGGEGELLSICEEASISDSDGGSGRWFLDNLFVTQTAVPVLVECKRAADPRIRREVVAQMFEYAANCSNWRLGEMSRLFAENCRLTDLDPEVRLREFLAPELSPDEFWGRVDANLRSGNMRLLFVADRIPAELARIIEFLNEQMTCEVLAVELNWFVDANGSKSIVPRTVGATQRAEAQRKISSSPSLMITDRGAWMRQYVDRYGEHALRLLEAFFGLSNDLDGRLELKRDWASITIRTLSQSALSILGAYPRGKYAINIGAARRLYPDGEGKLARVVENLTTIVGPLNGTAYPSFDSDAILDPHQGPKLVQVLKDFANIFES